MIVAGLPLAWTSGSTGSRGAGRAYGSQTRSQKALNWFGS